MRKWKWLGVLLLALAVTAGLAWWLFRPRLSDEEQIEMVVSQVEAGVEAKSPRRIMAHVSRQYSDSEGLNYSKVEMLSRRLLREIQRVEVNILDYEEPIIQGDFADLRLTAQVTVFSSNTPAAEVQGDMEVVLFKERGRWKVINAEGWQQWVVGIE
jgi:uncharacterized protein (DUF1810 family)